MVELLPSFARTWASALADLTLGATLVLGLAAIVAWTCRRRSAALRHAAWLGALVALLALPAVHPVWPRAWFVHARTAVARMPIGDAGGAPAVRPELDAGLALPASTVAAPPGIGAPPPVHEPAPARDHDDEAARAAPAAEVFRAGSAAKAPGSEPLDRADALASLAVVAWATGAAILLLRMLDGALRLRAVGRAASPAPPELAASFTRLCRRAGLERTPALLLTDRLASPATAGMRRPRVFVPRTIAATFDAHLLESLLRHEIAHVARGDALAQVLALVACALFWHHPLAWVAARGLAREREILADACAARATPQRADYAEALLRVVRGPGHARSPALALGTADSGARTMKRRLDLVIEGGGAQWHASPRRARLAVVALLAASFAFAASAGIASPAVAEQEPPAAVTASSPAPSAPAAQSGDGAGTQEARPASGLIDIELTDSLPVADPRHGVAYVSGWSLSRMKRAGKIFVDGKEQTIEGVAEILRQAANGIAASEVPKDAPRPASKVRLRVAATRQWADVQAILAICGRDDIAIRSIEVVPLSGPGAPEDRPADAARLRKSLDSAVGWLLAHQHANGYWPAGRRDHTAGTTGLALLALMIANDDGRAYEGGDAAIAKGLRQLVTWQDGEGGIGMRADNRFVYSQAIATLAFCEALARGHKGDQPGLKEHAQRAIRFILSLKNPYKGWRYGKQPGDNDTSVTSWMLLALKAAAAAGLEVDSRAVEDGLSLLASLTDPGTGRTGYTRMGEHPVRPEGGAATRWPSTESESLTAMSMSVRILWRCPEARLDAPRLRFDNDRFREGEYTLLRSGQELLEKRMPAWTDPKVDFIYWTFGTVAMRQMHGAGWERWRERLGAALVAGQETEGAEAGSWDPAKDPWGDDGGRSYTTALATIALSLAASK